MYFADYVAAFFICVLGYGAAVYHSDIRRLVRFYADVSASLEFAGECRRLREVKFASEGMKTDAFLCHNLQNVKFTAAKLQKVARK